MVHCCYTHEKDQAQYALCDWCVFKKYKLIRFFYNFALECESSERLFFLLCFVLYFCFYKEEGQSHLFEFNRLDAKFLKELSFSKRVLSNRYYQSKNLAFTNWLSLVMISETGGTQQCQVSCSSVACTASLMSGMRGPFSHHLGNQIKVVAVAIRAAETINCVSYCPSRSSSLTKIKL